MTEAEKEAGTLALLLAEADVCAQTADDMARTAIDSDMGAIGYAITQALLAIHYDLRFVIETGLEETK